MSAFILSPVVAPASSSSLFNANQNTTMAIRPASAIMMTLDSKDVSRRDLLKIAAASLATFSLASLTSSSPALADGAVSYGTKNRARGIYGAKILKLDKAIEDLNGLASAGEFVKVGRVADLLNDNLNAFTLFKTGYFADNKPMQKTLEAYIADITEQTKKLKKAAKNRESGDAQKASERISKSYAQFLTQAKLSRNEFEGTPGQKWSNDFDFKRQLDASPYAY